jgi:hypothetical protein
MRRSASQRSQRLSSPALVGAQEESTRPRVPLRLRKGKRSRPRGSSSFGVSVQETLLGALHVDASGIVLEHRPQPSEAGEAPARTRPVVGRQVRSLAPWASEPAFLDALQSAIHSSKVSFHFDYRIPTTSIERIIHVNILPAGDKTAWIFISDKTLAMISS